MKKTEIDKTISKGSVKQKIKLYLTDLALLNVDSNNLDYEIKGKEVNIKREQLLTPKERDQLFKSIKEPKDIKYYNELKVWFSSFLFFKERFNLDLMKLQALSIMINEINQKEILRAERKDLLDIILDLLPDKKTREDAQNRALKLSKSKTDKTPQSRAFYQRLYEVYITLELNKGKEAEKNFIKYLDLERSIFWDEIKKPTELAIETAQSCKEYLEVFKLVLEFSLPLSPFKVWVKEQEKLVKTIVENIAKITTLEDTPTSFPLVEPYDLIATTFEPEDLENFKRAGI
jgi:hypothetical protein